MKDFQEKLFIVLAICLCGLCAWQWNFQTKQRDAIDSLNAKNYRLNTDIQGYTNSIHAMDHQIAQMDQRISELKRDAATNNDLMIAAKRDAAKAHAENDALNNEIAQYKDAVNSLNGKVKDAYDGIKKQNDAMKELAAQRNDFVQKLNDSIRDRNDIVSKYNDLAERYTKLQTNSVGTK